MKIGTIGTGMIVGKILEAVNVTPGIECEAVYSRTEEKGRRLADQFGIRKVYTDLDEMCQDDRIDFIYIASPNNLHYEQAKKAMAYGKHVICEKPFTVTLQEAKDLAELAREKHLILLEAITTMYLPNYDLIRKKMKEIGKLKLVMCVFCQYSSRYDLLLEGETPNIFNPLFAGGALMDINLYNIYFAVGLFGKPSEVIYYADKHANGIDTNGVLILKYEDFVCQCTGAKDTWCDNFVQILGEKGYIHVLSASNTCEEFSVVTKEKKENFNVQGENQWLLAVQGIVRLVQENNYAECYKRLEKTLEVVEVLEKARESAGLSF